MIRGVSHISLSVRDLDRSLDFYTDVLELPILVPPYEGVAFQGRQALVLAGQIAIGLQEHHANDGATFDPRRTGLDHLALHVASVEQLEEWRDRLRHRDVPVSDVKEVAFGRIIEFRDPDEIQLEIFARDHPAE